MIKIKRLFLLSFLISVLLLTNSDIVYAGSSYLNWHPGMTQESDSTGYRLSIELGRKSFQMGDYIIISKYGYASDKDILSGMTYKSSNTKVATIDKNGKVVMKKKGSTIITAKMGSKTIKCTLKVVSNGKYYSSYSKIISKLNKMEKSYTKISSSNRASVMTDLAYVLKKANSYDKKYTFDWYGLMDNSLYNLVDNSNNLSLVSNKKIFESLYDSMTAYQLGIRKAKLTSITPSGNTIKLSFSANLSYNDVFSYLSLEAGTSYVKNPPQATLTANIYKSTSGIYQLYSETNGVLKKGKKDFTFSTSTSLVTGNYKLILKTGTSNYSSFYFTVK